MKRFIMGILLFSLSVFCFSQQNLPGRIIGEIPGVSSTKLYKIQVGAFKTFKNAEEYALILKRGGLNPVYEEYLDYTRVLIKGISAKQVVSYLIKIKQLGFNEVIIREDTEDVITPEPEEEIIEEEIVFEEEEIEEEIAATEPPKETPKPRPERDIFCRTWSIVNSDKTEYNGYIMIFTNDGTYLITNTNSESSVAKWRWYDDIEYNEFEYSHDNWKTYGRVTVQKLDRTSLTFVDPGYNILGRGHSTIRKDVLYELVPIEDL